MQQKCQQKKKDCPYYSSRAEELFMYFSSPQFISSLFFLNSGELIWEDQKASAYKVSYQRSKSKRLTFRL